MGSEPQIPFLAGLPSAIPCLYTYPLLRSYPRHARFQEHAWEIVARDLPAWILTTNMPLSPGWDGRAQRVLLDRVSELVRREYALRAVSLLGPGGGLLELPNARSRRLARDRIEHARFKVSVYRRRGADGAGPAPSAAEGQPG